MSCCKNKELVKKAINTVRLLAADGVQKANSGHPGMPMGSADMAFTLWSKYLRFDPKRPDWIGRDRFVLSAGHGSMLIYSLLHLFGYDVSLDDLKNFRQLGSKTPGHPEHGHTAGVEVTTGPLASGLASAVGMAIGQKQLAARIGAPEELFKDQRVYVISGDGCIMEGTSHEACSLAGHLKLNNLILFYDDNKITIEGSTSLAMSEDVGARFAAYGWNVLKINGQCPKQICAAITLAKACKDKPTIIIGSTTIGFGAPKLAGTAKSHGAPLGDEELKATKAAFGFDPEQSFVVPEDVKAFCDECVAAKQADAAEWDAKFEAWKKSAPEGAALLDAIVNKTIPAYLEKQLLAAVPEKEVASRASSGAMLQVISKLVPAVVGGSADLAPSNNTYMKEAGDFSAEDRAGRNFHFGIRELGMGLVCNGLALTYALPFSATFMVFSDYMKPAIRLAAIQKLHEVYVFTHDSYAVGEDGATHEPIEQLAMFRSIPGVTLLRPAESHEVALAWAYAIRADHPVVLSLTRQALTNLPADVVAKMDVAKGAYVVSSDDDFEAIIIGSGSELGACNAAAAALRAQGKKLRVVSMPSWDLFDAQSDEYKESVLPKACCKRIAVEAACTMGWEKYVGCKGMTIGLNHFGESAPYKVLADKYGFTAEKITAKIADYLA
ncbi:MAG: transketolase [Lentisphaeria bacterium]|nr:transketolase [Lentisphaeria bacterium]